MPKRIRRNCGEPQALVRHGGEHARMSTHENSRQRRHVRADLPLRAPRRGSAKSEQSQ
jgi:hypothetical protein